MSKNLQRYLDERFNFWRVNIDRKPALDVRTMTLDDANSIAESLVCDMSPENLTCDGELSRSQVMARARLYQNSAAELIKLFPNLTVPQYDEGLFDAPAELKKSFVVGATVFVDHASLGGRTQGTIVKVNRVKCLVEFGSGKKYHVPMGMIETV